DLILPLLVEESKPRLIWDGRWLNRFLSHAGLRWTQSRGWAPLHGKGAFMTSMDHKSGYHHLHLHPSSFRFFGLRFENKVYVFTTLCFGWILAPYIYQSLSDALAGYCRRLVEQIGLLTYLDDSCLTGS
ncbi:unnamed protein product, partial [Heterosigma akashiwo]